MAVLTPGSAFPWRPDQVSSINPSDLIPDALPPLAGTIAGIVQGDMPSIRVPYISTDLASGFVAEGADITPTDPALDEVVIATRKIAAVTKLSNESMINLSQGIGVAALYDSFSRSLTRSCNVAFLTAVVAAGTSTGLINVPGIVAGGALGANADTLIAAIATIGGNNGTANTIIASPSAWAAVRSLKATASGGVPLVGDLVSNDGLSLLGCNVYVSNQMSASKLLILDKHDVLVAWSGVSFAVSNDVYFNSDSAGVRATLRLGWKLIHPNRAALITTP